MAKQSQTITYGAFTFHKPRLLPVIITAIAVGMCLYLGVWQLQRLQWKEGLIERLESSRESMIIGMHDLPDDLASLRENEFHMINLPGNFDHTHEFHLMGQRYNGQLGYDVLTPFTIDNDGRQILVNRGWVPTGKKLPEDRPEDPRFDGLVFMKGMILAPEEGNWLLPDNDVEDNVWLFYDIDGMNAAANLELPPVVVEMINPTPHPDALPIARKDGNITLRNDHLNYAFIWFSLAFAGLVIFFVYHLESMKGDEDDA